MHTYYFQNKSLGCIM